MLQSLHVKNLALIEEAEVEWKEGLNILTGETGAGKSLLLGSVHLALGGKYSAAMLREGADYGLVELVFYVCDPRQQKKLERLEIVPEDGSEPEAHGRQKYQSYQWRNGTNRAAQRGSGDSD